MLLTKSQQRCIELVENLKTIKKAHLSALLHNEFPQRSANKDIDKLVELRKINQEGEYIYQNLNGLNTVTAEAVEVMMTVTDKPQMVMPEKSPAILSFLRLKDGVLKRYVIFNADNEKSSISFDDSSTAILLTQDYDISDDYPGGCIVAVKEGKDYKFFQN